MAALMRYVDEIWLNNAVWEVRSWCMFEKTIRTINDCEGWHHEINRRTKKGNLQFYLRHVIVLLYMEASLLPTQVKMVSERKAPDNCRADSSAYEKTTRTEFFSEHVLEEMWKDIWTKLLDCCLNEHPQSMFEAKIRNITKYDVKKKPFFSHKTLSYFKHIGVLS